MNDDLLDIIDDLDPQAVLAEAERITFQYEVLLANLRSRIIGGLYLLSALVFIIFGTVFFYLTRSPYEIDASLRQLLPSLLVVLLFALVSTARWMQTLRIVRNEGLAAFNRQVVAQRRVLEELQMGAALWPSR